MPSSVIFPRSAIITTPCLSLHVLTSFLFLTSLCFFLTPILTCTLSSFAILFPLTNSYKLMTSSDDSIAPIPQSWNDSHNVHDKASIVLNWNNVISILQRLVYKPSPFVVNYSLHTKVSPSTEISLNNTSKLLVLFPMQFWEGILNINKKKSLYGEGYGGARYLYYNW